MQWIFFSTGISWLREATIQFPKQLLTLALVFFLSFLNVFSESLPDTWNVIHSSRSLMENLVSCIRLTAVERHEHDWLHPTRIIHYSIIASSKRASQWGFTMKLKTQRHILHPYCRQTWIFISSLRGWERKKMRPNGPGDRPRPQISCIKFWLRLSCLPTAYKLSIASIRSRQ